jgi:hypothetical protein
MLTMDQLGHLALVMHQNGDDRNAKRGHDRDDGDHLSRKRKGVQKTVHSGARLGFPNLSLDITRKRRLQ